MLEGALQDSNYQKKEAKCGNGEEQQNASTSVARESNELCEQLRASLRERERNSVAKRKRRRIYIQITAVSVDIARGAE